MPGFFFTFLVIVIIIDYIIMKEIMMRSAIYARVSTEEEKQIDALAIQIQEARYEVSQNNWILTDEYIDEGITGTTTKKRDDYKRLCDDIAQHKFDIVVVKDQERLMRNTRDWYLFIDLIVNHDVRLYFYLEKKFYTADDKLLTGIRAILAEEFSRNLSKKINNAHATRQRTGRSIITNGSLWGYTQKDGELSIDEEEAEIVRRIFDMYNDGKGVRIIKQILDNENVTSKRGTHIGITTIKRMIKNPIYIGTVVQNTKHYDFDKKCITALTEDKWITHPDRVPAIIEKSTWEKANKLMQEKVIPCEGSLKRGINKGSHDLSSKIECSECHQKYHRTMYVGKNKIKNPYWICAAYQTYGRKHPKNGQDERPLGCDGRILSEKFIYQVIDEIVLKFDDSLAPALKASLSAIKIAITNGALSSDVEKLREKIPVIIKKRSILLDKYLDGKVTDEDYSSKSQDMQRQIDLIEKQITDLQSLSDGKSSISDRITAIESEINNVYSPSAKRSFIIKNILKILVFQDHLDIYLNFLDPLRYEITKKSPVVSDSGQKRTQKEKIFSMEIEYSDRYLRKIQVNIFE